MTQYLLVRPPRRYVGSYFDMSIVHQTGETMAPFTELARWSRAAARKGKVTLPGEPIVLPPRPQPPPGA
jgi:hypothetical protein